MRRNNCSESKLTIAIVGTASVLLLVCSCIVFSITEQSILLNSSSNVGKQYQSPHSAEFSFSQLLDIPYEGSSFEKSDIAKKEAEKRVREEEAVAQAARETQAAAKRTREEDKQKVSPSDADDATAEDVVPDWGVHFRGATFPIGGYLGNGSTCPIDGNVYMWTAFPNFYCIDIATRAGSLIRSVNIGEQIHINGRSYIVSDIVWNYVHSNGQYNVYDYGGNGNANGWSYDAIIQSCSSYSNPCPQNLWLLTQD